ncbi:hypothetical protein Tco_1577116 [Tanacetum coccineum]
MHRLDLALGEVLTIEVVLDDGDRGGGILPDIPESHGKMVKWLDDEIPRNRIPILKRDLLGVARFPRWVETKVVSSEVESEKWRGLLLHQMCVSIDVATDGRKEDFFP